MARLKGPPDPLEVARFRGVLHYTKDRGLHVVKRWPRPRGQKATPAQLAARADFLRLVRAVEDMRPEDKIIAKELAAGTGYTWRDVLSRAACGELIIIDGVNTVQIQTELDKITNVEGAMLLRSPLGWVGLLPGAPGRVLKMPIVGNIPGWEDAGGAGLGLLGAVIGVKPTVALLPFTTWQNQGGATITDCAQGICLFSPNSSGDQTRFYYRATPAGAYGYQGYFIPNTVEINAGGRNGGIGLGWSDGTKGQFLSMKLVSGTWLINVQMYSNAGTFAGNNFAGTNHSPMKGLRIEDTGTTVSFRVSSDYEHWSTVYSTTKTAGYLGAAGYTRVGIYGNGAGADTYGTIAGFQ